MAGERRFTKLGTKVKDLQSAAADRIRDAEVLRTNECYASAIAMGLYALEITPKIAICRRLDLDALPADFQIHDLEGLMVLSGLSRRLRKKQFAQVKRNWNSIRSQYNSSQANELRYAASSFSDEQVAAFLEQLHDSTHGVIIWLSAQV